MISTVLQGANSGTGGGLGNLLIWIPFLLLMIGIFYFTSRKQKKQDQEIANMRDNVMVGDEITTIGGIIGKVISIKEETLVLETSRDGTKIRILKSAIRSVDVRVEDTKK